MCLFGMGIILPGYFKEIPYTAEAQKEIRVAIL